MLKNIKWWLTGWLVVVCLALIGCATNGTSSMTPWVPAPQTPEQLLSAAGFKQVFPTTPTQKTKLASMPQKQIFSARPWPNDSSFSLALSSAIRREAPSKAPKTIAAVKTLDPNIRETKRTAE